MGAPVTVEWTAGTDAFSVTTDIGDKTVMRGYTETMIRKTFCTPEQMKLEYNNIPEWDNETVMFEFGTYSESSETTELSNNCIGRVEIGK